MTERITVLLTEIRNGVPGAADRLWAVVYDELRRIAARAVANDRPEALQVTEVVHEAYLRLVGGGVDFQSRAHFLGAASRAIRQFLIDDARARRAGKRGGTARAISLSAADAGYPPVPPDVLDLDSALRELAALDERQARLVELRFFGGLTSDEAAAVLGVSERTAAGDWAMARAWLRGRLGGDRE